MCIYLLCMFIYISKASQAKIKEYISVLSNLKYVFCIFCDQINLVDSQRVFSSSSLKMLRHE